MLEYPFIDHKAFIFSHLEYWIVQVYDWFSTLQLLEYMGYGLGALLTLYIFTSQRIWFPTYIISRPFGILLTTILVIGTLGTVIFQNWTAEKDLTSNLDILILIFILGNTLYALSRRKETNNKNTHAWIIAAIFGSILVMILKPFYGGIIALLMGIMIITGRATPVFKSSMQTLKKQRQNSLKTGLVVLGLGTILTVYMLQTPISAILGGGMAFILGAFVFLGTILSFSVIGTQLLRWGDRGNQVIELPLSVRTLFGFFFMGILIAIPVGLSPFVFFFSQSSFAVIIVMFVILFLMFLIPLFFLVTLAYSVGALCLMFWERFSEIKE